MNPGYSTLPGAATARDVAFFYDNTREKQMGPDLNFKENVFSDGTSSVYGKKSFLGWKRKSSRNYVSLVFTM